MSFIKFWISTTGEPDEEPSIGTEELDHLFKCKLGLTLSSEQLNAVIAEVDEDKSGRIEFGEFLILLAKVEENFLEKSFPKKLKLKDCFFFNRYRRRWI